MSGKKDTWFHCAKGKLTLYQIFFIMKKYKEKRKFLRVGVKRLTSIIRNHEGSFDLVEQFSEPTSILINVKDISVGGFRIESKLEIKKGLFLELSIPKIQTLDASVVKCEVTRLQFQTGEYHYDID